MSSSPVLLSASTSPEGGWPVGTFIVEVAPGGDAAPEDFTITIESSGGGTATPSSFPGSTEGTPVSLAGGGTHDLAINTEPGYTRSLGSDCQQAFAAADLPQAFTCTITFTPIGPLAQPTPTPTPAPTPAPAPAPAPLPQPPHAAGQQVPFSTGTIIVKVVNDNGGTKQAPEFAIDIISGGPGSITPSSLLGMETYSPVTYSGPPGSRTDFNIVPKFEPKYTHSFSPGCPLGSLPPTFTCTITFDDIPPPPPTPAPAPVPPSSPPPTPPTAAPSPTLPSTKGTVIVIMNNDNGGTGQSSDVTVEIIPVAGIGVSPSRFPGSASGTEITVTGEPTGNDITYTVPSFPGGYVFSSYSPGCFGDLVAGFTCTITFDDIPPLKVVKNVTNHDDQGKTAQDFTIRVTGDTNFKVRESPWSDLASFQGSETPTEVRMDSEGTYEVEEIPDPDYDVSYSPECSGSISAETDPAPVCIITNEQIVPEEGGVVHVEKTLINDNGGTKRPSDFTVTVQGNSPSPNQFNPLDNGSRTIVNIGAGQFNITERNDPGYSTSYLGDCAGIISTGEIKRCLIENDDRTAKLWVVKRVINDNGGEAQATDFLVMVTGNNPSREMFFPENGTITASSLIEIGPGEYRVAEDLDPDSGYSVTYSDECSGTVTADDTIRPFPYLECTITNNDVPPAAPSIPGQPPVPVAPTNSTIKVIKNVTNDNGGVRNASDFTITVSGNNPSPNLFAGSPVPNGTDVIIGPGPYNITERDNPRYNGTYSGDCSGTIAAGENRTCIITNDDKETGFQVPPSIRVIKNVINDDNIGDKNASDFTIKVTGNNPSPSNFQGDIEGRTVELGPGSYRITEDPLDSLYDTTYSNGCSGTIEEGENEVCIITNNDISTIVDVYPPVQNASLRIIKNVTNDNNGVKEASDFTVSVEGNNPSPDFFQGNASGTTVSIGQGSYRVLEEPSDPNYDTTYSPGCYGTIAADETKTCTITNNDIKPVTAFGAQSSIRITKNLINDNGGTKEERDFTIVVEGNNPSPNVLEGKPSPGDIIRIGEGQYRVVETPADPRYDITYSRGCSGIIGLGESKDCVITNNDKPPTTGKIMVIKDVVNDDDIGTKDERDFTITVRGNSPSPNLFAGSEAPVNVTVGEGQYSVTEILDSSYDTTYSPGCYGTIAADETKTCTITNNDIKPVTAFGAQSSIRITKNLINDNGGTKEERDFTIVVEGNNPSPNVLEGKPSPGDIIRIGEGQYRVVETPADPRYDITYSRGCSGIIGLGESKDCVITNNDKPLPSPLGSQSVAPRGPGPAEATGVVPEPVPITGGDLNNTGRLQIIKNVTNDNNGTKEASDFTITLTSNNNSTVSFRGNSSGTVQEIGPGPYLITESIIDPSYSVFYSADCIGSIRVGENKSCVISNNDKPPRTAFGAQPSVRVIKNVINDNNGSKIASDFTIAVAGSNPSPNLFRGAAAPNETIVEIDNGTYAAEERIDPTYNTTYSQECAGTIAEGEQKLCIITNDDSINATIIDTIAGAELPLAEQMTSASPLAPPLQQPGTAPPTAPQSEAGVCDNNGNGLLDADEIECMAQLCGTVTGKLILADPSICDRFPLLPAQNATQPPPEPDVTTTTTTAAPTPPTPPPTPTPPTDTTTAAPPPSQATTPPPSPTDDSTIPVTPPSPPVEQQPPEPLSVCPLRTSPSLEVLTAVHGETDPTIPTGCNYSKVEVRATSAGSGPVQLQSKHLFIVYTDENGKEYVYRGGHGGPLSTQNPFDYRFGSISAVAEEYAVGANDWDPKATTVTVLEGKAAQDKGDCFAMLINPINAAKIDYELEGPNSNTVAWTLLTKCGISPNKPAGSFPGWGGSELMAVQPEKRQ